MNSLSMSNGDSEESFTGKCEICGKGKDLLMCLECQDKYNDDKLPHRDLVVCEYGHLYAA